MVWAAIGWDWKSELIFLEREEGKKGYVVLPTQTKFQKLSSALTMRL